MMDAWIAPPGGYGLVHWLIFAVAIALVLYPVGRILNRMGFSPFWSLLVLVPFFNLLGLWILALRDWPRERNSQTK